MKIQTNLRPRTNGTVIARNAAGKPFVFKADESGALVCDIDDPALVAMLLARGDDFEPADPADFEAAQALVKGVVGDDDEDGEDDDEGDGEEVVGDGMPQEANTPPKASARPRKVKAATGG